MIHLQVNGKEAFNNAHIEKALCVAGTHNDQYSDLLNTMAGIVFLGTPHRLEGVSDEEFGDRLVCILKLDISTGTTLSRQSLVRLRDESPLILDLADRFNETNIRVNMLSIFEERSTQIKDSRALRSRTRKIIVRPQVYLMFKASMRANSTPHRSSMSRYVRLRRIQNRDSACSLATFNFRLCVRNMGIQYYR